MNRKTLPIFDDISFNEYFIEDYLGMQVLSPDLFDRFCADGWCYWSDLLFRRNYWPWRDETTRVIVLRIDLEGFSFSKSQRKRLRKNADLRVRRRMLKLDLDHIALFHIHSERFSHNRPASVHGFFSPWSHVMPCKGQMFEVFDGDELIAASYFHIGNKCIAGNYGIHHPDYEHLSLGTYTMLLEIEWAMSQGYRYYYPGFVYDVPSEFDYKLNFNNLEYFDWAGSWYPIQRMPVRSWREEHQVAPPLSDAEWKEYKGGGE
ncbi:MAG: GNAT family N-acetyltransferase [Saprospiraceae bacterium]